MRVTEVIAELLSSSKQISFVSFHDTNIHLQLSQRVSFSTKKMYIKSRLDGQTTFKSFMECHLLNHTEPSGWVRAHTGT